jgi:hypothetical protein
MIKSHDTAVLIGCLGLLAVLWSAAPARAQADEERIQFYAGVSFEYIDVYSRGTNKPFAGLNFTCFNLGGHYQIVHARDRAALTVNPNAMMGFILANFAGAIMFELPVFLMGRIGANCTRFNENRFGIGLGIGPKFTYFGAQVRDISGRLFSARQNFVAPAAALELNFGSRSGNVFTVRAHANLGLVNSEFNTQPSRSTNYGFGFVYFFERLF